MAAMKQDSRRWSLTGHSWVVLMIGSSRFIRRRALGVVAWFMNWVRARGFTPFATLSDRFGDVVFALLMRGLS